MNGGSQQASPRRLTSAAVILSGLTCAVVFSVIVLGNRGLMQSVLGQVTPLLLLAAVAFGAVAVRYSAAGLPLLVVFVYLNLSQALVRYHDFPSLLQILVVGLAFAAWLKRDTDDLLEVARQPLTIALLCYILILFATTAIARDRELADERLIEIGKAFVIYVLATLLMRNEKRLMQGVVALAGSAAFLGFLVLIQFFSGDFSNEFGGLARIKDAHIYGRVFQPRIAGPLGDPNFFAQILLLALPFPILFGAKGTSRRERAAWFAATALILAAIFLTYSRGAIVAIAVMGLVLLKVLHVRWRTTAALIGLLVVSLLFLPRSITERVLTIGQIFPSQDEPLKLDSSFEERQLFMRVAWVMFGSNPVLGVGAANYTARYDDYVGSTGSAARQYEDPSDLHFPHNLYLETAAESGLVGIAGFLAILVASWSATRPGLREPPSDVTTAATAFRISLIGYLVSAMFLHLAFPRYLFLLFAFAATVARLRLRERPS